MNYRFISLACLIFLLPCGCGKNDGPKLSGVSGTILFDGKPLSNAAVMFQPEFGRPAFATTDDQGHYTLKYSDGSQGAATGKNTVSIRTEIEGEQGHPHIQKELLPNRYHDRTTLSADVIDGPNTIDFELTSK